MDTTLMQLGKLGKSADLPLY